MENTRACIVFDDTKQILKIINEFSEKNSEYFLNDHKVSAQKFGKKFIGISYKVYPRNILIYVKGFVCNFPAYQIINVSVFGKIQMEVIEAIKNSFTCIKEIPNEPSVAVPDVVIDLGDCDNYPVQYFIGERCLVM